MRIRRTGVRVCVGIAKLELQRLKPHSFCRSYVVAKATTHKEFPVLTQTLEPVFHRVLQTREKPKPDRLKPVLLVGWRDTICQGEMA